MKIYIKDENGRQVEDENRNWKFIDLTPCSECEKQEWAPQEQLAIEKSVQLIFELAGFECAVFHALSGCIGSSDWHYRFQLGNLCPVKRLSEYGSYEIGILRGVLRLAFFAGTCAIDFADLLSAYRRIKNFITHIHNHHREADGKAIAPSDWFNVEYTDWIDCERLIEFLPDVRGKSMEDIVNYLDREWESLKRCEKCNAILVIGQGENGPVCYKCDPPQIETNPDNAAQIA